MAPSGAEVSVGVIDELACTQDAFAGLGREILLSGRSLSFQAHGTSMVPLVRDGDVVLVEPIASSRIRIGEVVLVGDDSGRVVVHRVIRQRRRPDGLRYTVQGDQVAQPDGVVPAAQILGRVTALERAGARIELDRPAMRILGMLATLRSRWNPGRGGGFGRARALVRKLPWFSRYLT